MPNPLVSVIIPIYNVELYLKECLDSVIYQSYQNLEILLINDGSTDKSGDIAKEYASQDKRIRYFEQENQGQSVARNKGLDYVNGEYIYFLDSDDWIDLGYIEELVRKSDKQNTAINTNRVLFNTKIQERITTSFYPKKNGSFKLNPCSIDNLSFYVTNSLFKYKIIQKYSIRFPIGRSNAEDSDFLYRYICFAPYIIFYQGSIYHYRQRQDSTIGYIQQSQKIPLEPLDTFKSIYQWYQHYDFLYKYGLPFKLIYTFSGFEINKQEYFHTAKNLIKELKIPSAVIAKNHIMRAFMEAVDMDSFLYKRLTLNTNIFKRFFRIRLFHKNYNIIRLFGYTLYEKIASNANGGGGRD
ncbi:glycosyltransferase family 2 protein [Helicobacter fennelliae]|uniref:glycosyltransferase family 2 protein n=1 Tax=Helicobacter fennelliae TaxID=215 RepID=UPI001B3288AB|nr:glycosyltransferase family 2 protein [Helicobacter fennelliae]